MDNTINEKIINSESITWGPFLWRSKVNEDIILELSRRALIIRNSEKNNAEHKLAALMHDEWSYSLEDAKWFVPVIDPWVKKYLEEFSKNRNNDLTSKNWYLQSLWVNYQKQYDFNPPHNHSGSLSFVIYLNVPEELKSEGKLWKNNGPKPGAIVFQYGEELPLVNNKVMFMPTTGDIFIFPASLVHLVIPFRSSNVERISVSGNILIK